MPLARCAGGLSSKQQPYPKFASRLLNWLIIWLLRCSPRLSKTVWSTRAEYQKRPVTYLTGRWERLEELDVALEAEHCCIMQCSLATGTEVVLEVRRKGDATHHVDTVVRFKHFAIVLDPVRPVHE